MRNSTAGPFEEEWEVLRNTRPCSLPGVGREVAVLVVEVVAVWLGSIKGGVGGGGSRAVVVVVVVVVKESCRVVVEVWLCLGRDLVVVWSYRS